MRPKKLIMTGFESYKDRTEIDFEKLGTKGLYLITGDTGAGKTTIFDAITFVLYGSPSGSDRSVDMLRSHFADERTPTLVELYFEAKGKEYHITRNPDYERKALRGEGTTKESANALLEYITDKREPVSGLSKVNAEIENILNLKKEQFCRIAMIAQGSFQKLLLSKKEEKQSLFRELFHTEKYQILQDTLKTDKSKAEKTVNDLKNRLHDTLARIKVNEKDEKADEINLVKSSPILREEDIQVLKDFVLKDEELLKELELQISESENELDKIKADLQTGQRRNQIESEIKNTEENKSEKENEKINLDAVLSKAEEAAKKVPDLEKEKTLLEESLKDYQKIAEEENHLEKLNLQIKSDEEKLKHSESDKSKLSEKIENLKREVESLKNAGEKIVSLQAELEKISEEEEELKDIEEELANLSNEKNELKLAQSKAQKANNDFLAANNFYSEELRLFNLEQAGILAEGLKEGLPCPVCGSKEHPHLAVKSEKAPSQVELENAKNKADELQKEASNLSIEAGQKKTSVEKAEEIINKEIKKYFENLTVNDKELPIIIEERKSDLKNKEKENRDNFQKEEADKARREEIDKGLPEFEEEVKKLSDKINQLQNKISSDKATLESGMKILNEKKSSLKYQTLEEAQKNFNQLENQIERLKENFENAKNDKNTCEKEIANFTGSLASLKKQLAETKEVDIQELEKAKNTYSEQKDSLEKQKNALIERRGINQESLQSIIKILPEISKAKDQYNMISALSEVAAGSSRGRSGKPSLEVYVQMHCLDQINRRANLRFKTMTDNKYELRRRIEEDGSELGLDLNIKDFYTGRERNVQTLSGGEQFQASLSLALGLADEVQDNSGGIKLDTMFIDEGFGTLDPDTLNKAMKALEDLSNGNKLVGIISHVEELESRIPKKIVVKKDEAGISHATLVNLF
ncbi:MAG: SMC family ATPase [Treponema sp.]|nr:SMC family ATPase [Treponema sp.]